LLHASRFDERRMSDDAQTEVQPGTPGEVFLAFLKLGLTSFGGPVAHVGYFRSEFVGRRKWLSDEQFGQLLAICQFLPGPASSQFGLSIGLLRSGWRGALAAFVAFTLPSVLLLVLFAAALPWLSGPVGKATLHGTKLMASAVVAHAVFGMATRLCPDRPRQTIAIVSAVTILLASSASAQLGVVVLAAMAGVVLLPGKSVPENQRLPRRSLRSWYWRPAACGLRLPAVWAPFHRNIRPRPFLCRGRVLPGWSARVWWRACGAAVARSVCCSARLGDTR
jgi:chromate transport protein ChrA